MRKLSILAAVLVVAVGLSGAAQVSITFWHAMSRHLGETLTVLVDKFMDENPDVKVDLIFQGGYGALQQKLIAAVAAGEPPTLVQEYENWTTQWLDALVDLDLFLPQALLDDIHPSFAQEFDGRVVTIPFNKSIVIFYYRPDLVPTPPTTWEEYKAMIQKVAEDTPGAFGTVFRSSVAEIFLTLLAQAGGSILSEDWSEVTINDERGLEVAEFVAEIAKYTLIQGGFTSDAIRAGTAIGGFYDTSAGYRFNVDASRAAGVPIAVAPLPCYRTCASAIQGTNLTIHSVNQSRAQIQAAARLIEFLLREDNIVYWATQTGYLPPTTSALTGEAWQSAISTNEAFRVATEQALAGGFGQLLHPKYMDMRPLLITYWELLLRGEGTPKEIMDALAAEIAFLIGE